MPSVGELSAPYANFMLSPRAGPGVCVKCFNFTDGYEHCFACTKSNQIIAAVAPISYSVAREQLHHALASYKRLQGEIGRRLAVELAAVLWRFLSLHESCVAKAARVPRFELVTTVPSSNRARNQHQPLRRIVGQLVAPTRERYERLLDRSALEVPCHTFSEEKYLATRTLNSEPILLIDDTWTTGANAQSAAAALRRAGAGPVAAVVLGRHVTRGWHANGRRLEALQRPFDWRSCALCARRRTSV